MIMMIMMKCDVCNILVRNIDSGMLLVRIISTELPNISKKEYVM